MFIRKHFSSILLALVFLTGLSLLLYPSVSERLSARSQSRKVEIYADMISHMREEEYRQILLRAKEYNEQLARTGIRWRMSDRDREEYRSLLRLDGTSIMGYIEIPRISTVLPICHGTDEEALLENICHLEGTSLPVGGESSHCILTGHRGLPGARLFTDLDRLKEGDIFTLTVLDRVLVYQVDLIRIVRPDDLGGLEIYEGRDLCTLVTCTPYGINTHRLLVRGRRIEGDSVPQEPPAREKGPFFLPAAAVCAALLLIIVLSGRRAVRNRTGK